MAFNNRVRLPIKITRPQFPEERSSFRKANGVVKTISVVVRKTFEGETDWMPERWHERLKIALAHDEVAIEGDKYLGSITQEGDYEIEWQTFLDYPTAKAKFKVQVTPFNATNANCQSCKEATQVDLSDDTITAAYGGLEEGETYTWNVAQNDSIYCHPAVFSISSFNNDYLASASIDQAGVITVVLKNDLPVANNILLATYKVSCPNGGYDEANVYANINGTIETCLSPISVAISLLETTTARATWVAADPAPGSGYRWELFEAAAPGSPVQTGATPGLFVDLTGLTAGTNYTFYVYSVCDDTSESNFTDVNFTTQQLSESKICGSYLLEYGYDPNFPYIDVTYLDCNSEYATVRLSSNQSRYICALQNGPGAPVYIVSYEGQSFSYSVTYSGLCNP